MTLILHPLWFLLEASLDSFPTSGLGHSLTMCTSKKHDPLF